jgi:hypothetical protein
MDPKYTLLRLTLGVIATVGLYSVLYRENKFYRFWEHIFLGLATGFAIVALWAETLKESWWDKMVGSHPILVEGSTKVSEPGTAGYWAYAFLLPIGLMGYFVFSRKHNWISRIPIGIILGLWSGQQVQVWWNQYGPQMANSIKPLLPTTGSSFTVPFLGDHPSAGQLELLRAQTYPSQAISNLVFTFTLLSVVAYFLFSFEVKTRVIRVMSTSGRWLLMVGFGAIFGSTVMMRFSLLIDQMYFIWIEWLTKAVLHR